ncbi:unnamed protein product, partial [Discosporangium mesarthrocarpum]
SAAINTTILACSSRGMPRVLADQLLKEPISVNEVCASLERKLWENAMSDEIAGLLQNNVWTEPVKPPQGRRVIDTKWVLK